MRFGYTFLQVLDVLGGQGDADAVKLQLGGVDAKLPLEATVNCSRRHGALALVWGGVFASSLGCSG